MTTAEVVFLRTVLAGLSRAEKDATTVYGDNEGSVSVSKNPAHHGLTKAMHMRSLKVQEWMREHGVEVRHVSGEENITDMMTKPLPQPRF